MNIVKKVLYANAHPLVIYCMCSLTTWLHENGYIIVGGKYILTMTVAYAMHTCTWSVGKPRHRPDQSAGIRAARQG